MSRMRMRERLAKLASTEDVELSAAASFFARSFLSNADGTVWFVSLLQYHVLLRSNFALGLRKARYSYALLVVSLLVKKKRHLL